MDPWSTAAQTIEIADCTKGSKGKCRSKCRGKCKCRSDEVMMGGDARAVQPRGR